LTERRGDVKGNTVEETCGRKDVRAIIIYTFRSSYGLWALINIAAYDAMISKSFVVPTEGVFWGRIRRLHVFL
jgi:hypothetical protein